MQCSVPRGQKSGVFCVHAVVITILLYTFPGRQLPLTAGGRGHMLRKGTKVKRGEDNRHVGTLSISVHEDKENAAQTLVLGGSKHQEMAEPPGDKKSPDHS